MVGDLPALKGSKPVLRMGSSSNNQNDGDNIVTDSGNYIVDLVFDKPIEDAPPRRSSKHGRRRPRLLHRHEAVIIAGGGFRKTLRLPVERASAYVWRKTVALLIGGALPKVPQPSSRSGEPTSAAL